MSRYLNYDHVMMALEEMAASKLTTIPEKETIEACIDEIDELPAMDITKCRECFYFSGDGRYCGNDIYAKMDGYCFHGEPKEQDNE